MDPLIRSLTTPTALQRAVHLIRRLDHFRPFSKGSAIAILDANNDGTKKQRPKTVPVPKITLMLPNDSSTVTILEEAQRLAKRRNLILIKVTELDSKTLRPVYKLTSSSDYVEGSIEEAVEVPEDNDKDKQKLKDIKLLYISAKIAEHDLRVKLKNVVKLLNKNYRVKLAVTLDDGQENKTRSIVTDIVKDHSNIQQMPAKKNMMLLLLTPLSKTDASTVKK